ncbi:MAG: phospholipase effector Tle1 domain-containing protein [Bryobacteraceae bacterium]
MPKNIIVCSDGTGNTAIKNRGTNVFKLFEAIDLNGHRTDFELTPQIASWMLSSQSCREDTRGLSPPQIFRTSIPFTVATLWTCFFEPLASRKS